MKTGKFLCYRWTRDILLIFAAFIAVNWFQSRDLMLSGTKLDPTLSVLNFQDQPIDLFHLLAAGRPSLVFFWAPWCNVCKSSIQNALHATDLNGLKNQIFFVALDYFDKESVDKFVQENDLPAASVFQGNDSIRDFFRVSAYPTYYVIRGDGSLGLGSVGYSTTLGMWFRLKWG